MFAWRRFVIVCLATFGVLAQFIAAGANPPTVGLLLSDPAAFDGYTLFSPIRYPATYLINNDGNEVHTWLATHAPTVNYLQPDGTLLRSLTLGPHPRFTGGGGGATGRVERVGWDGTILWRFDYRTNDYVIHHDIKGLPNGNVLMIAWEAKSSAEAIAAGRNPALLAEGEVQPDYIIEVQPTGPTSGVIVWEWHAWDHLVQDFDITKANYGDVGDHRELIDINYIDAAITPNGEADWLHSNAIDYNEQLDQIMLSVRHFSELWVIDHSTTTAEAAGHTGGNSGKGGDILYRWGNPESYRAGDASDRVFYLQHDTQWIRPGLPGAGNILVFNNGNGRPGGSYSSADELVPPVDKFGNYAYKAAQAFGPAGLVWTYVAPDPPDFYSAFISGAQRLPNGNTLINDGVFGKFFEVSPADEIVWTYVNPVANTGPIGQGMLSPPLGNIVFRANRYAADYPGFEGHDLTPGLPLEVMDSDGDGLANLDETKLYGTGVLTPDTDGDGLSDGQEVLGFPSAKPALGSYVTDPLEADTDGDGCTDGSEAGGDPQTGGLRDPTNPYDYFNPTNDGIIRADDMLIVIHHYFVDDDDANPGLPPYTPGYTPNTDRLLIGPHPWNLGPGQGVHRIDDVLNVRNQYFNDCA